MSENRHGLRNTLLTVASVPALICIDSALPSGTEPQLSANRASISSYTGLKLNTGQDTKVVTYPKPVQPVRNYNGAADDQLTILSQDIGHYVYERRRDGLASNETLRIVKNGTLQVLHYRRVVTPGSLDVSVPVPQPGFPKATFESATNVISSAQGTIDITSVKRSDDPTFRVVDSKFDLSGCAADTVGTCAPANQVAATISLHKILDTNSFEGHIGLTTFDTATPMGLPECNTINRAADNVGEDGALALAQGLRNQLQGYVDGSDLNGVPGC